MYLKKLKLWNFRKYGNTNPFDPTQPHGYFCSICASDFGRSVPGVTVQTVPFFTVRFVPV